MNLFRNFNKYHFKYQCICFHFDSCKLLYLPEPVAVVVVVAAYVTNWVLAFDVVPCWDKGLVRLDQVAGLDFVQVVVDSVLRLDFVQDDAWAAFVARLMIAKHVVAVKFARCFVTNLVKKPKDICE